MTRVKDNSYSSWKDICLMVLVPAGQCMLCNRVHTSENVSLVHVVRAEDSDSAGSAALQ